MPRNLVIVSFLVFKFGLVHAQPGPQKDRPNINDQFPIRSGRVLSPPIVLPVGDCAKAVHVTGYIPHAIVRVFAHVTELIGTANPYFAEADIPLTRALHAGESITATQEVLSMTSSHSVDPMIVGNYPAVLGKPVVQAPVYECGQVVPVNNLNPGTQVSIFQQGNPGAIGEANATQAWQPVVTSSLVAGSNVFARQTSCPGVAGREMHSDSDPIPVLASPSPVPPPVVEAPPVGADAVTLHGLLTGSLVDVSESGGVIGSGLATGDRNYVPVHPVTSAPVTATQKLCNQSGPSDPVTPTTTLSTPILLTPVCEGTHYVIVRGAYVNSILVLFRNGIIAGMAGATLGDVKMALGGGAVWNLGDEIRVLQYVGPITSSISAPVFANCSGQNVITQHNDNSRSGSALHETILTPAAVSSSGFGKLYTRQVDGDIVGQPLFVRGVRIGAGTKDLFLVTTSKNNIYAFDADDLTAASSTPPVWSRNLCSSERSGVCGETYSGVVGITSTPVIDPNTQTMYVVANCTPAGTPVTNGLNNGQIRIFAINIADSSDRVAPVAIAGADPTTPATIFDPHCQRNRPGLLLSKGIVYAAFATFSCDAGCATAGYHGWIIGYRASDLRQTGVFCTSPAGNGAGIWQTGNGLAADENGSIYLETGNGDLPLHNSFLKISVSPAGRLALAGSFMPNNAQTAIGPGQRSLNEGDTDLGSGGPLLLPNGRLIGGGKQGRYYVLDQETMRLTQNSSPDVFGFDGFQAFLNTYHMADAAHPVACAPQGGAAGCQIMPNCSIDPRHYGDGELCGPNIHGGPVYWRVDNSHGLIYEMPEKDYLKAFRYDLGSKHVTEAPSLTATGPLARPPTDGMPGGYSSISANGRTAGIVWTSLHNGDAQWALRPGRLVAFDALTLRQIWADSDEYTFAKAVPPTIANGKVIRATGSQPPGAGGDLRLVAVYGFNRRRFSTGHFSIDEKYANFGGALGALGKPISEEVEVGDKRGGKHREFRGDIFGMASMNVSIMDDHSAQFPTCSVPKGKTTVVNSSIYWSPQTYAHVVQGEIGDYWIKLGGVKSKLGYPIADETYTPDHMGRRSNFEHGEIWWYEDKGAYFNRKSGESHDRCADWLRSILRKLRGA